MTQRKSNVELLRIGAMMMIICIHYFATCNAGDLTVPSPENRYVYVFLESMGICGVNVFVLITGYFSLNQREIKPRKFINLLIDVAFWGGLGFALSLIAGWKTFDLKSLIKTMFPIMFGTRWFVKAYLILLCLIPFINIILRSITLKSYRRLLIICTILFSIWPSFLPNPPMDDYGYSFVHFVFLYIIAGYIKLHVKVYPSKGICMIGFISCIAVIIVSNFLPNNPAWAYNYMFVIIAALSLLMLFLQIEIQSTIINKLAACAFGVFLIHTDGFFSKLIYDKLLHCNELVSGNTGMFILSALASMPIFYTLGFVLESAKKKLFAVSFDRLLDKLKILNKPIEIATKIHES